MPSYGIEHGRVASWPRLLSLTIALRVVLGIVGGALVFWLPTDEPQTRRTYLLIVFGAYLPYAFLVFLVRERLRPSLWFLTAAGDLAFVFAFRMFVPSARYAGLFGFLLIAAFYTAFAGIRVGAVVGGASIGLAQIARALTEPAERIDDFTLVMHAVMVVTMVLVVGAATNERRRILDTEAGAKASALTHELRLPLSAISGFAGALLEHWDALDDRQRREALEGIGVNAGEAMLIADTILGPKMMGTSLVPQPVEILGFIRTFSRLHAPALEGRVLRMSSSGPRTVLADPPALDRVLGNLLLNAVRHSPAGSPVTVSAAAREGTIVVSIVNQVLRHDHDDGETSGGPPGMGLMIARTYLRRMGGALDLRFEDDRAIASFTLPDETVSSPSEAPSPAPPRPA